jgi:membrane protein YqaA with SNARE-associated domain
MYNVCTLTRFLKIHHYVLRPITRQQIFTFNARLRTERSAKIRAPTVKAQFRLTVWRRCGAEGLSKGSLLFWHFSSLSGNFVFHLRWFFENRLLAAQIAQIPHCALVSWHEVHMYITVVLLWSWFPYPVCMCWLSGVLTCANTTGGLR